MRQESRSNWLTILQLILSAGTGLLLVLVSTGGLLLLQAGRMSGLFSAPDLQLGSALLFLAGMGFAGMLLMPSALTAAARLFDFELPWLAGWRGSVWLIGLIPPLLMLGYLADLYPSRASGLLPVAHVLVNGVIVFWLIHLVVNGLEKGSDQRFWGIFGSGLVLSPLLSLVMEILLLVAVVLVWSLVLARNRGFNQELLQLLEQLSSPGIPAEDWEETLGSYLTRPGVVGSVVLYIALLIPLVEEALKVVGLFLLLDRDLGPREGFILGAVSGAGYALFENLALASSTGMWLEIVISRWGTTSVHILASGLVGWGLISAVKRGRTHRLVFSYLAAVLVHGLWNALNVLLVLSSLPAAGLPSFVDDLGLFAPAGLVVLAVGCFLGLIRVNIFYKRAIMAQVNHS